MKPKTLIERLNFSDLFSKPKVFPKSEIANPIIAGGAKLVFPGGTPKERYEALVSLQSEIHSRVKLQSELSK